VATLRVNLKNLKTS